MLQMNIIKKLKTSYVLKLSSDQRLLCHTMGGKTVVYDTKSWEKVAELPKPNNPGDIMFSKDNGYLYIKNTIGSICVYDTTKFQLVKNIQSNKSLQLMEGRFALTNNPFKIFDAIKTKNGNQLAAINIDKGEYEIITNYEDSVTIFNYQQYIPSEDSHLFTLSYETTEYREYKLLKINEATHEITLISHPNRLYWNTVIFDVLHQSYIVMDDYELIILDSTFNKVLRKKTILKGIKERSAAGYFTHIHQSSNGKYIVITYCDMVLILQFDDLEIIVMEIIPNACFAEFCDDNQYLLVGTWRNGFILENNLQ